MWGGPESVGSKASVVKGALLFALVRQRKPIALIRALLESGVDPNVPDSLGTHVLTLAVLRGDVELVRELMLAGADPHVEEDGRTILSLAREAESSLAETILSLKPLDAPSRNQVS